MKNFLRSLPKAMLRRITKAWFSSFLREEAIKRKGSSGTWISGIWGGLLFQKRKQGFEKKKETKHINKPPLIKAQRNMITFWWKCEHWTRETSLQEQVWKRDTKDSTNDTQPAQREPRWEWPHQEQQLTVFYPSTRTHQQLQIIITKWWESKATSWDNIYKSKQTEITVFKK